MIEDYLMLPVLDKPLWMWAAFLLVIFCLLLFDLGVLNRKDREITIRQSLRLSVFYISMGLLFGVFIWQQLGPDDAQDYYTGFIIEKTLSLDNIFVISLVFSYFTIPRLYQYRVLFWGVLGVIILRALLIGIGAELVHSFEWVLSLFAAFLVFTGIKMLVKGDDEADIAENIVLKLITRLFRVTPQLHAGRFFVRQYEVLPPSAQAVSSDAGKDATKPPRKLLFITPLFISLLVVECVDLIFALDSVPAIFAVTTDEYVVYTSNVFAILGLRALYFALAAMLHRFEYLNYSLSAVLIFIGGKVFYPLITGGHKLSSGLSLSITLGIIAAGVLVSLVKTRKPHKNPGA